MSPTREPAFTVLFVCTGNICRSALAERLGRAYLDEALGEHATAIRLVSAGVGAVVGSTMHPDSALVLSGLGAEAGDFRARQLEGGMVAEADLTLTMTRSHRREVLHGAPRTLARTFTLREAVALLQLIPDDAGVSGADCRQRATGLVAAMAAARSRRHSGDDDDIRDPIRQPLEVHAEVGEAIAAALLPVLDRLARPLLPGAE